MSHHGNNPSEELSKAMRDLMGEYPAGRLNKEDAGALAFSVGVESGKVVLRFPKPVAWMGMTGDEAMGLAQVLIKHARKAGATVPLRLNIGE